MVAQPGQGAVESHFDGGFAFAFQQGNFGKTQPGAEAQAQEFLFFFVQLGQQAAQALDVFAGFEGGQQAGFGVGMFFERGFGALAVEIGGGRW